jgi:CheY-like chemotaxis protein
MTGKGSKMSNQGGSEKGQVVVDVLVVEDDADMRAGMVELLDEAGLAVGWAANGREALDLTEAGVRPRLLLLDMQMPVMEGWTLLEQRRKHPVLRSVPVILTTALDRLHIVPNDVVACLQKPVDPDQLIEIVRQHAHAEPVLRSAAGSHAHYLDALSAMR